MKKAQTMGLPFQFIFSLILVAVVIVFGFFGIRMFLQRAEQVKFGDSFIRLQQAIEEAWSRAGETNESFSLEMPKEVKAVCFFNRSARCSSSSICPEFCNDFQLYSTEQDNFFFCPLGIAEKYGSKSGKALLCYGKPCVKITRNPLCFPVQNNKLRIRIVKEYGESLVRIENE